MTLYEVPVRSDIVPVILSGGSGTRLWPLSRAMYPKQFLQLFGRKQPSLLGAALARLPGSAGFAAPVILGNSDHRFLIEEETKRAGLRDVMIVLEPVARNTAPAIAVAALMAARMNSAAVIVVMPSDQLIANETMFRDAVRRASAAAATGRHVLFGIEPDAPHAGFGYIRKGTPIAGAEGIFEVSEFCEKPDATVARTYLEDGGYYWNSGIFVLHAATFLKELQDLAPEILTQVRAAVAASSPDLGFLRLDAAAFAEAPNISTDYAIMERTRRAAVMPLDIGWNDVGSWASLWEASGHDTAENHVSGEAVLEDTSGCHIHSERGLVATIGIKDLVIVNTPDALLVADKSRSQDVSRIVTKLKAEKRSESEQHVRSHRPWGYFETLSLDDRFQVKKLHVMPGGKLSLQMHHHRSEHWIVVQGTAKVTIGETEKLLRENESVYIFATQWHRLENPGKVPLELIEVQIGSYLGEDDIVRGDDIYKRAPEETK